MSGAPNVLLITVHDAGRHFGCYGAGTVRTPAIDALAADGVRFARHFATSPVCSPSRGAMLTGRYPQSNGLLGLTQPPYWWSLHPGERHLARILGEAGYHTALFGIQHEGTDAAALGFAARTLEHVPNSVTHPAHEVAAAVGAFLRADGRGATPFYAQIGLFEPHTPYAFGGVAPDDTLGVAVPPYVVDSPPARQHLAGFQGAVRAADRAVGTILAALDAAGLAERTIVIFATDHGIELPRAKWFCYEPGLEAALIMRWPGGGIGGGGVCDWLLSNVDLVPTLLELLGLPCPATVQGRSFAGAFRDGAAPTREAVYAMFEAQASRRVIRAVRTARHKLIRNFAPARPLRAPVDFAAPQEDMGANAIVEFYDLAVDPREFHNLADSPGHADAYAATSDLLWRWLEEVDDPLLAGPVATPIYHLAMAEYRASGRGRHGGGR